MNKDVKNLLIEYILEKGEINGDIINVEQFLNHQVDPFLLTAITDFFDSHLTNLDFDKIITVESSGIVFATALSIRLNKPFIFIKKKKPITMKEFVSTSSYSFTKKISTELFLSKRCISNKDTVVVVDDFYANGDTHKALLNLSEQVGFKISKYLVVINKSENNDIVSILNRNDIKELTNEKKRP